MTDKDLIREAQKRGFLEATSIIPAHLVGSTHRPTITIPKEATLETADGNVYFSYNGSYLVPSTENSKVHWTALVYSKGYEKWAEIVTSREITAPLLRDFPNRGVCWEPTAELVSYLKNKTPRGSGQGHTIDTIKGKGVAWNDGGLWTVQSSSSQPEYTIEQLTPFLTPSQKEDPIVGEWYYYMGAEAGGLDTGKGWWEKGVLAKFKSISSYGAVSWEFSETSSPNMGSGSSNIGYAFRKATDEEVQSYLRNLEPEIPEHLKQQPLTPEECFKTPERWVIKITEENKDALENFLVSRKDEYRGYRDSWDPRPGFYFFYPQPKKDIYAASRLEEYKGYTLVTLDQIKHVLTQNKTNLSLKENGKQRENNSDTGTICKIQRPNLAIRRDNPVREIGIRCTKSKIRLGVIDSEDQIGLSRSEADIISSKKSQSL